jgi:diguanylate cyclase (GGDEF)-like protein
MSLAAALIYWVIIALWLAVLTTVCVAFFRNPRTFGAVRLLLSVIVVDTIRNIIENLYFGLYFGGQYGLFPASVVGVLGNPNYLILPKVMNVVAASAVFGLLVLRWLPLASKERADADATVHEKMEALNQLAHFDQLTGLPNRVSLREDIDTILRERAGDPAHPITVAMLDLDGFKDVNDTLGHSVGDRLLQEVARRLTSVLGETRVYRLGEHEFVLVLEKCGDPLVASDVVETILKRLTAQFDLDGHQLFVAANVGLAIAPAHGSNVDDLLANADLALYDAKAAGSRSCRLYVPTLRARAKHRRELDTELRRACANQEFVLYFQPQVRSSDGAVIGAEALLRWHHPERGILAPGAFIDALGESAVAIETGRWILTDACKTAACWRAKGLPPIRMGVNLFPAQFRNGSLLLDVEQALSESGLPPDALELEITENIALGREEGTLAPLKALRARGVGIAFDDFGTGYASLSYLTRYPLTRIKIDRSFIQKIGEQSAAEDTAIVRSIIVMGRNLGLEVIAEGVETTAQADFLKAEGCPELQGFLFSKPLPANAFEHYLRLGIFDGPEAGLAPSRLVG